MRGMLILCGIGILSAAAWTVTAGEGASGHGSMHGFPGRGGSASHMRLGGHCEHMGIFFPSEPAHQFMELVAGEPGPSPAYLGMPMGGLVVMAAIRLTVARHPGESWREALSIEEMFPGRHHHRFTAWIGWLMLALVPLSLIGEAWALGIGRDFVIAHPTFQDQLPYLLNALIWNREMDLWSAMQLLWAVPFLLARRPAMPTKPA